MNTTGDDQKKIKRLKAAQAVVSMYEIMDYLFKNFRTLDIDGVKEFLASSIAILESKAANKEVKAAGWHSRRLN